MAPLEIYDAYFGWLKRIHVDHDWQGMTGIPPHGKVEMTVPREYTESAAMEREMQATMDRIAREEQRLREMAARDLFEHKWLHMYGAEADAPEVFVANMHLRRMSFDMVEPPRQITLWYEYADGREHGIVIYLTPDGIYQHVEVV
jgi:hypothetical protein